MKRFLSGFFTLLLVLTLNNAGCRRGDSLRDPEPEMKNGDLARIQKTGKLRVVVDYNSTNYFVYRGKPMGFKYELLQHLAKDMGVKLEIVVSNNMEETFRGLNRKRYDLVAKNLTVTTDRKSVVAFTVPLEQTRQVLVQRKPDNWRQMSSSAIENHLIRNQLDLAGKTIHVQQNTTYYKRLLNLSEEIGAGIDVRQDSIYGVEELVSLVAAGKIDYTVCDENVARVNQTYYPNIDVATPVSFPQNIAWAVRKNSEYWLEYLNDWITAFRQTAEYRTIYRRYYESSRARVRVNSDYYSITGGRFSDFDDLIKEETEGTGFDWKLIAAIISQESDFNPEAESWAGAFGLMQVMPETADMFRITDLEDPRQNIRAGVRNLLWLEGQLKNEIVDFEERVKFVLASYNVGLGHVRDAQRLAEKYGKNSLIWEDNVDYYLLNKSASRYYKDEVVRWGYCRGQEPYEYVDKVLSIFHHYKNTMPE